MSVSFESRLAALTADAQKVTRSKPISLVSVLAPAGDALGDFWEREGADKVTDAQRRTLAVQIGKEAVAAVQSEMGELGGLLSAIAGRKGKGALTPEDLTVSRSDKTVTARYSVRSEGGASASVSVSFPLTSDFGRALAAVVPVRK